MAIARNTINVQFSSSDTVTVSAGGNATSDDIAFSSSMVTAEVMVKADYQGTPADDDDTVDVYLQRRGDPDNNSTTDQETVGTFLCQLDLNSNDPDIKAVTIAPAFTTGRLYIENNGDDSVIFSAQIVEITSS